MSSLVIGHDAGANFPGLPSRFASSRAKGRAVPYTVDRLLCCKAIPKFQWKKGTMCQETYEDICRYMSQDCDNMTIGDILWSLAIASLAAAPVEVSLPRLRGIWGMPRSGFLRP